MSQGRYDAPADWEKLWDRPAGPPPPAPRTPTPPPAQRPPGRRRRRRLLWFLVVVAVIVVLLAVGLFGSVGLTLDGNTMVRNGSYTFELPGRWWPSADDRGAVDNAVAFYRGPFTAAGRLHVAVTRERKAITIGELQQVVPFRVATVAHGRIVKRISRVRLGGEDAIQLDYEFSRNGTRTYTRQILCPRDGVVYGVMILAVPYSGSGFEQSANAVTRHVLATWGWGWRLDAGGQTPAGSRAVRASPSRGDPFL